MTPEEFRARLRSTPPKNTFFTFSNVLSVVSLLVALTGLSTTIYYNFLWHPEAFQVTYKTALLDMFDSPSSATFVFTNSGKQAVSVEKVSLERLDGETNPECSSRRNQNVRTYVYNYTTKPAQAPSKVMERALDAVKLMPTKASRVFKSIELTHIFLDNKEANSTALLVDAQSAKILSFDFSGDFLREESRSIYCFEITVYDRTGARHTKSLPGWTTTHEGEATLLATRTSFDPVTLLPPE